MEYLEIGDLGIYRKNYQPSEANYHAYTRQILQALVAMHALGYTHRDIKPGVRPTIEFGVVYMLITQSEHLDSVTRSTVHQNMRLWHLEATK